MSVDVPPDLISSITGRVMSEDAVVRPKAVHVAIGVLPDGSRDILEICIENTEVAKFWMKVFNDRKIRWGHDI